MKDIQSGQAGRQGSRRGGTPRDAAVRRRQVGPRHHRENHQGLRDVDLRRPRRGRRRRVHRHGAGRLRRLLRRVGSTTRSNWFYSVFSSIPYLLLILAVAAVLQQKGTLTIVLILGLTGWSGVFRLIRAEYLKHKGREYVHGGRRARRIERPRDVRAHLSRTSRTSCWCSCRSSRSAFIKAEVILSFLGFGVPVDVVSWGSMLNEAQNELILGKWWQLVAGDHRDGHAGDRVQPVHRRAARARSIRSSRAAQDTDMDSTESLLIRWFASATCASPSASTSTRRSRP